MYNGRPLHHSPDSTCQAGEATGRQDRNTLVLWLGDFSISKAPAAMQSTMDQIRHAVQKVLSEVLAESTWASEQDSPHQVQDQERWQQQQENQSLPRPPAHTVQPQLQAWLQQQQQRSVNERQHILSRVVSKCQEQVPGAPQHLLHGILAAVVFEHELQNGAQLALQQGGLHGKAAPSAGTAAVGSRHTHAAHTEVAIIATPDAAACSIEMRLLMAAVGGMAAFVLKNTRAAADDVWQVAAAAVDHVRPVAAVADNRVDATVLAASIGPTPAATAVPSDIGMVDLSTHVPAPYFISQSQHLQGSSNPVSSSTAGPCRGEAAVKKIRVSTASLQQVKAGLSQFIAVLRPTLEVDIMFHAAFTIVQEACIAAAAQLQSAGHPCGKMILAGVNKAGSYANTTHLSKG